MSSQLNSISNRLNPTKFNNNFFSKKKLKKSSLITPNLVQYLNLLDCYGEYQIKKLINK